jgi:hypothetical protein
MSYPPNVSFAQGSQTTVFIPDCFNGDPMDPTDTKLQDKLSSWLEKHPPSDACAIADKFLLRIKESYQSIQVNSKIIILFNPLPPPGHWSDHF